MHLLWLVMHSKLEFGESPCLSHFSKAFAELPSDPRFRRASPLTAIGSPPLPWRRFLTYDTVRDALRDSNGKITPVRTVLAGICAGAIESIVAVTPSESIK